MMYLIVGNSGTAMRLFCGLLASVEGSLFHGDKYLRSRPMKRVADPLRSIGANIDGRENGNKAPLFIRGGIYFSLLQLIQLKLNQL